MQNLESQATAKVFFKASFIFFLVGALFVASYFVIKFVLWALVGVGIACILAPAVEFLKTKWKIPRALGVLLIITLSICIFFGLLVISGAFLTEQAKSLSLSLPDVFNRIQGYADQLKADYPSLKEPISELFSFSWSTSLMGQVVQGFKGGAFVLTGLIMALAVGIYTAISIKSYFKVWVGFFPRKYQEQAARVSVRSAKALRAWFAAQLIDMLIVGAITGLGLWIIGVQYWAVFGLLTGLLVIFPYVGVVIAVLCTSLVVGVVQPDKLLGLLIVYVITQQIEGNIILPLVMKKRVQLPAAPLIFFMVIMGVWFGLLGVFIAPPMFAVLRTIYHDIRHAGADAEA